jgi:hypothetical protein
MGSTIDPDWSIKKIKQLGLTRLISAEYGIALFLTAALDCIACVAWI